MEKYLYIVAKASRHVTRLVKLLFGNGDGWTFNNVVYPKGDHDKIVKDI